MRGKKAPLLARGGSTTKKKRGPSCVAKGIVQETRAPERMRKSTLLARGGCLRGDGKNYSLRKRVWATIKIGQKNRRRQGQVGKKRWEGRNLVAGRTGAPRRPAHQGCKGTLKRQGGRGRGGNSILRERRSEGGGKHHGGNIACVALAAFGAKGGKGMSPAFKRSKRTKPVQAFHGQFRWEQTIRNKRQFENASPSRRGKDYRRRGAQKGNCEELLGKENQPR